MILKYSLRPFLGSEDDFSHVIEVRNSSPKCLLYLISTVWFRTDRRFSNQSSEFVGWAARSAKSISGGE